MKSLTKLATLGASALLLSACGEQHSTSVEHYKLNPEKIEQTLMACQGGRVPSNACQAAAQAKREASSEARVRILENTLAKKTPSASAQ